MEIILVIFFIIAILVVVIQILYNDTSPRRNYPSDGLPSVKQLFKGNLPSPKFSWRRLLSSQSDRRRDYYRNVYLKSDAWKRKRYLVLRRDNWRCVYCGGRATQVHHKRYAKKNIGREPIDWLVSVCKTCHEAQH